MEKDLLVGNQMKVTFQDDKKISNAGTFQINN